MSYYNNIIIPQLVRKCQCRLGRHNPPIDQERIINTAADDTEDMQ